MKNIIKAVILLSLALLAGCPAPKTMTEPAMGDLEGRHYDLGVLTFISGEVLIYRNSFGDPLEAVIGDMVYQSDSLKTGADGYCEIQFEDAAVIRMEEGTLLSLEVVSTLPGERDLHMDMVSGTLLAKVNRMTEKENLSVRTRDTVCGVRGTQFLVKVDEKETLVAVKEGRVAVLPQALAVDSKMVLESPELEDLAEIVDKAAPVLSPDQQIKMSREDFQEAEEVMSLLIIEAEVRKEPEAESFDRLEDFLEGQSEKVVDLIEAPQAVNKEASLKLNVIDSMDFVPLKATVDSEGEEVPEEHLLILRTEPADAEIYLGGSLMGRGEFSRLVIPGESYEFSFVREGYSESVQVFVPEDSPRQELEVRLLALPEVPEKPEPERTVVEKPKEPEPEPVSGRLIIRTVPEDAKLVIKGRGSFKGAFNGKFDEGSSVVLSVEADGYHPRTETIKIRAGMNRLALELEKIPEEKPAPLPRFTLSVTTDPSDARVSFNGSYKGRGDVSGDFEKGKKIPVTVSRRGFESYKTTVGIEGPERLDIRLNPRPLEKALSLSETSLIKRIGFSGGLLAVSDSRGKIGVFNAEGQLLWSAQTGNTITENSAPVLAGGRLYYSGDKELDVYHARSGELLHSLPLSQENSHIFGKETVVTDAGILFPAEKSIALLDGKSLEVIRRMNVKSEIRMTPGVYKERMFVVDSSGSFHSWDLLSGEKIAEVKTPAQFPVAMAPVVHKGRAYLSGRKGTVICMDLESNTIIWEAALESKTLVFCDMQVDDSLLYVYSGDTVFVLDADTGEISYTLDNVSAPPLLKKGRLYYGTGDKSISIAEASSGKLLKQLALDELVTTRPTYELGVLFLGTASGKVLFVIPEAIK